MSTEAAFTDETEKARAEQYSPLSTASTACSESLFWAEKTQDTSLPSRKKYLHSFLRILYNPHSERLEAHYKLGAVLGEGSYGKVYAARPRLQSHTYMKLVGKGKADAKAANEGSTLDSTTPTERRRAHLPTSFRKALVDAPFACKVLRTEFGGRSVVEHLHKELVLLAECQHESVVQLVERFETPEHFYVVLGRCYGDVQGLQQSYQAKGGFVPLDLCRKWAFELCSGLAHVHSCGVAHCDVKPDNLLLKEKGMEPSIVLGDFGFARKFVAGMSVTQGTPNYLPPEIFMGGPRGVQMPSGDAWAAGVTLYEIITNLDPFDPDSAPIEALVEATSAADRAKIRHLAEVLFVCPDIFAEFEEIAVAVASEQFNIRLDVPRLVEEPLLGELVQRLVCRDEKLRATMAEAVTLTCFNGQAGNAPMLLGSRNTRMPTKYGS